MEARPTTSMKKGWLCRTFSDEKNHEIAPVMIQWWWSSSDDPDLVMIPSDDPDPVMMTSDDPDLVTMSHDDPDREMIQIQILMMN